MTTNKTLVNTTARIDLSVAVLTFMRSVGPDAMAALVADVCNREVSESTPEWGVDSATRKRWSSFAHIFEKAASECRLVEKVVL